MDWNCVCPRAYIYIHYIQGILALFDIYTLTPGTAWESRVYIRKSTLASVITYRYNCVCVCVCTLCVCVCVYVCETNPYYKYVIMNITS